MAIRKIRTMGDRILNKVCRPVEEMTPKIQELIEDMLETMYDAYGVGLAAPQVGMLKRIVVIDIGDEKLTLPAVLERTEDGRKVFVTLHEGRFHQIKRMFLALNNQVIYLKRVSMKNLTLDPELKPGDYRRLTAEEIADLQKD